MGKNRQIEQAMIPVMLQRRSLLASGELHVDTSRQGIPAAACPTLHEKEVLVRALWQQQELELGPAPGNELACLRSRSTMLEAAVHQRISTARWTCSCCEPLSKSITVVREIERSEQQKVRQFCGLTDANPDTSRQLLDAAEWDVQSALESWLAAGGQEGLQQEREKREEFEKVVLVVARAGGTWPSAEEKALLKRSNEQLHERRDPCVRTLPDRFHSWHLCMCSLSVCVSVSLSLSLSLSLCVCVCEGNSPSSSVKRLLLASAGG